MDGHDEWLCVTELGTGWAAVHMWTNREDYPGEAFVEPFQTGCGRYATRAEAVRDAHTWAAATGLPFVG